MVDVMPDAERAADRSPRFNKTWTTLLVVSEEAGGLGRVSDLHAPVRHIRIRVHLLKVILNLGVEKVGCLNTALVTLLQYCESGQSNCKC